MSTPRQKRSKFVPIPLLCFIVYSVATADPSQVTLIRTPNGGIQPQAAMDRQGALHLIYYKGDARNGDIFYVSQQLDQKEFSKPIQVNTRPGSAIAAGTIRGAQMALGRNGRVHVAWIGPAPERGSYMEAPMLYARLYDTRTAFEAERDVITFARGTEWAATGAVTLPTPAQARAAARKPLRALIVVGGQKLDPAFFSIFDGYEDVVLDCAPSNREAFSGDIREKYDTLVLYDYSQDLDKAGRKNLRAFVEAGKGVVVLHQAIADYNDWPWWYQEVVGGRYVLKAQAGQPASTSKEGEDLVITAGPESSPVSSTVVPMHLIGEAFKGMWISKDVKVLLTTSNPNSDSQLAWVSPYRKSRVVYIQLGHDKRAYSYPAYRQLVKNAVLWTAGRELPGKPR